MIPKHKEKKMLISSFLKYFPFLSEAKIIMLKFVGGEKVFLPTNEIYVGWGPKPKLDDGLGA